MNTKDLHLGDIYSSNYQGLLHDVFPLKLQTPSSTSINAKDNQKWAQRIDILSIILCLPIFYNLLDSILNVELPEIDIYTQLFFGHSQLIIIIGLTQDTGKTAIFSRICRYKYYGVKHKRMFKEKLPSTFFLARLSPTFLRPYCNCKT